MAKHFSTLVSACINLYADMVDAFTDNLTKPEIAVALIGIGEELAAQADGQFLNAVSNMVGALKRAEKRAKKFTTAFEAAKDASVTLKDFAKKIDDLCEGI